MKLIHVKSLQSASEGHPLARVECISWSPNLTKLAICTSNSNQIIMYETESGEKKDKFALKSVDKKFSRKSFAVKGIAFSPDSQKLAVGQTDNVIYTYKLGDKWGDKKSIVAKYSLQFPVTSLIWPQNAIVFGSTEGKIKHIHPKSSKISTVISHNSMCVSLASVNDDVIVAGFLSGAVMLNHLSGSDSTGRLVLTHSCPPFALCVTTTNFICVGGSDGRLLFLYHPMNISSSGSIGSATSSSSRQSIELRSDISCASASSSGNVIVIGTQDKIIVYVLESKHWRQRDEIQLMNCHLITSVSWSCDATKLIVGTVEGAVELFECKWRKARISDQFEVNYVGHNQVVVKMITKNLSSVFKSDYEIKDVKILRDKFVIIWTTDTLIVSDLYDFQNKTSEIEWNGMSTDNVKFGLDNNNVVLINLLGELYLVELGSNDVLASVRTDFINPRLMSVRINERKSGAKIMAYLLDLKTISIVDLISGVQLCNWNHDDGIDWLELNETGKRLLFRDKSYRLYLLDILSQDAHVLLNYCGFVQWVPGSDVIVAQSKDKINVWYDYNKPTILDVAGGVDAIGVQRENGQTTVLFSGGGSHSLVLDEVLLELGTALEDGDLERAVTFLESRPLSVESESMWHLLGQVSLKNGDLAAAERAFAAIGDIPKASFVRDCGQSPEKLALLEKDWSTFETQELNQVVDTYIRLHKWEKAIDFVCRTGRNDLKEDIEKRYYEWLLETKQEAEAGLVMERMGNIQQAMQLYLKSGRVVQAFNVIMDAHSRRMSHEISSQMVQDVIKELCATQFFEEAGQLYECSLIDDKQAALDCYKKGNAYNRAIELARREFPDQVVSLEAQYGEYLMTEAHDPGAAVGHFIEAGKTEKALQAAIEAGQYERAAEMAAILENVPSKYGKLIGDYYANQDQIENAIDTYLSSNLVKEAVALLNSRGMYSKAYRIARKLMDAQDAKEMYATIASKLESEGKLKEAEKIYLVCEDVDSAIQMYKNNRNYDAMIRLVKQHHPNLLKETHLHLAKELEEDGKYHQAETHYVAADEWKAAVHMYKNQNLWEEAYRVARANGGSENAKQVAFVWAQSLGSDQEAVKMLSKFGLLHQVVDHAVQNHAYDMARSLVANSGSELKHKLTEITLKYAMWLEDEGRFEESEQMFIEANRGKEAVLMYLHNGDFENALRVAQERIGDEDCIRDVLVAHGKSILEKAIRNEDINEMMKAESLLLRAARIEVAVKLYKEANLWEEALRACEQYAPQLIDSVKREMISSSRSSSSTRRRRQIYDDAEDDVQFGSNESTGRSATRLVNRDYYDEGRNDGSFFDDPRSIQDPQQLLMAAEQSGDRESVVKYAILYASQLVKEKSPPEALNVITQYSGCFLIPQCKKLVMRIASDLFAFESLTDDPDIKTWKNLRDAIYQVTQTSNLLSSEAEGDMLHKYLLIAHYFGVKAVLSELVEQNAAAKDLHTKLCIAMLRYTDIIRVDKAFYEAGLAAKENHRLEMAFVFWNHFLDLIDAVEEGQYNVDHSDFIGTDIPYEVPLPQQPFYAETNPKLAEQVKSWILEISMDSTISQSLPIDPFRDGDVYEASLVNADSSTCLPCLVSAYPVIPHKMLEFKPGKYAANRDDWNKLLMLTKSSDSESLKEILHFVGQLCGKATIARFSFQ